MKVTFGSSLQTDNKNIAMVKKVELLQAVKFGEIDWQTVLVNEAIITRRFGQDFFDQMLDEVAASGSVPCGV